MPEQISSKSETPQVQQSQPQGQKSQKHPASLGAKQTREGKLGPIKAKQKPLQRKKQHQARGFDPASEAIVNQLIDNINTRLQEIRAEVTELQGRRRLNRRRRAKLTDLQAREAELAQSLVEIQAMRQESALTFTIQQHNKPEVTLNVNNTNNVIVKYDGTDGSLINELTHAYQYLTGRVDFIQAAENNQPTMIPGLLYDIDDEIATYRRQYALDGQLNLQTHLDQQEYTQQLMNGTALNQIGKVKVGAMNEITPQLLNRVSDGPLLAPLYSNIAQTPLDVNSSTNDVLNANQNRANVVNSLRIPNNTTYGADARQSPFSQFLFFRETQ